MVLLRRALRRRSSLRVLGLATLVGVVVLLIQACVSRDVLTVDVSRVIVRPGNASLVEGEQLQFEATVEGANGRSVDSAPVRWSSGAPDVLAVDSTGMVTAMSPGTTSLRAALGGVSDSAQVEVIAGPAIRLTPDSIRLLASTDAPAPDPVIVSVENEGGRFLRDLETGVSYPTGEPGGWLRVSLNSSVAPAQLTLRAAPDSLEPGRYSAAVSVSSPDARNGPQVVAVHLSLRGLLLSETGGGSEVTEAGSTDTVSVVLEGEPDSTVFVDVESTDVGEVVATPATLEFTSENWNVPQIVVLTGQDEVVSDGDAVTDVFFAVDTARSDETFAVVPPRTVAVTTRDDDEAGFVIRHTDDSTVVSETGTTDSIAVGLIGAPLDDVVLTVGSADTGEVTVAPTRLTFTPELWDVVQFVTVTGVDDGTTVDGTRTTQITVAVDPAASEDAFDGLASQSLPVNTLDDDSASFTLSETGGSTSVSESGSTDSLTLVLDARPTSSVVFDVTSSDVGEVLASPGQIVFDTLSWDQPRTVVLTGVDDALIDGAQVSTVRARVNNSLSADAFDGQLAELSVTNADDDRAGLTLTDTANTTVSEGGSEDPFFLVLDAQPVSPVVVNISSTDPTESRTDSTVVTFMPASWSIPKRIVVRGVDDAVIDGTQGSEIILAVDDAGSDDAFDGLTESVRVLTTDDDQVGLTVEEIGGTVVNEGGGTDQFSVVLDAEPLSGSVVVRVTSLDTSEATVDPGVLTFTASDWDTPQTVTVTGVDDDLSDGDQVTPIEIAVDDALSDDAFDGLVEVIDVTTRDDDVAAIVITEVGSTWVTESGSKPTDEFGVSLTAAPSSDVVLSLSTGDLGEATLAAPSAPFDSLRFTPSNWSDTLTVTVNGVDDLVVDGDVVTALTVAVDPGRSDSVYDTVPARTVNVETRDDDVPGFTLGDTTGLTVDESGSTADVFTVVLDRQPLSDVVLDVTSGDTGEVVATPQSLTFTPSDWSSPRSVTLGGVDDVVDDGDQETLVTVSLDATASDPLWGGVASQAVGVRTLDDDEAILSIDDLTVLEANAGNAVFTVTISTPSASTVTVDYATIDGSATSPGDYSATSGTLTFVPGTTSRSLAVSFADDALDEADETFTVELTGAVNATLGDASGLGTILDDDPEPSASIDDVTVSEGDAGSTDATFTVSLSAVSGRTVNVDYATSDGTAEAPGDYAAASGTLSFPAGTTTRTVTVAVRGDAADEPDETFAVDLGNPVSVTLADASGVGTIVDDDPVPTVSIGDVTVTEGDSGSTDATFPVTLSNPSGRTVTVEYATSDGTAVSPDDYLATSGTLTFPPGTTTRSVVVAVNGELRDENDETFTVDLSNPANATLGDASGLGTILDDDDATLTIDDVTVGEGDTGDAVFTVTLSSPNDQTITVDYATRDGTAVSPDDYTATSGTLTFAPGTTSRTVAVSFGDDALDEADETFTVELSNAVNGILGDATGLGTITDDDPAPSASIDDVTVAEGDVGTTDAVFTVSLSAVSGRTVTLDYATSDGTAQAPGDYAATSGSLSFPAGTTSRTVTVAVAGDGTDEVDETFAVDLSNPVNVTLAAANGLGTIVDDDPPPSVSIGDVTVTEGDSGTNDAVFTVTLSNPSGRNVTVDYATSDGTASAPSDYAETSGTLTFAAGTTSRTVNVPVSGDVLDEGAGETFTIVLTNPVNATLGDASGLGTIADDDDSALSIGDATALEGDAGAVGAAFTVTLSNPSTRTVTVDYATRDGTAVSPADYTAASGTLTFAPGTTSQTVSIGVNGDLLDEADETFTVDLTNPVEAVVNDASGLGTIIDDDAMPSATIDDVTVSEGDGGTTSAVFTVTLSAVSGRTVTLDYATSDGTAQAPGDYTATSGTLTFPAGTTSRTVTVAVGGDVLDEADETFTVDLASPVNVTLADTGGLGTIVDDDPTPSLAIGDVTLTEGDSGTNAAVFTVTLSSPSGRNVTVDYASSDGTASAPADYVATSGTLTFTPGTTSRTVSVSVNGDVLDEIDETFTVDLTNGVNVTLADASGLGTITDDDDAALAVGDVTVLEGNAGTTSATFAVTLSNPSTRTVTVDYATSDGTAVSPDDYTGTSGTLTFGPGTTSRTVSVDVAGDLLEESDETFTLDLTNPAEAVIADASGLGTILDDDASLSIGDATVNEGNGGRNDMVFTVQLSAPLARTVSVDYQTTDGTATAPDDYTAVSGTLIFDPGTTSLTITVSVIGDRIDEGAFETFFVDLTNPVDVTISDARGTGTINDNDSF